MIARRPQPTLESLARWGRPVAVIAFAALSMCAHAAPATDAGESIYLHGVTSNGSPVRGQRDADVGVKGMAAACVNCHQRSGFGAKEGRTSVPPITARYLFRQGGQADDDRAIPYVPTMRGERLPYTEETLAKVIRKGIDSQGRTLTGLMPRYQINDADMASLIAYLKRLDMRRVPGVTESTLHFATIITPDADPRKRQGMLDVMNRFFADKNVRQMTPVPPMLASGKTSYGKSMFMVHRRWELHVWELSGDPSTWQQQLNQHLAAEPVFAVISGLAGKTWAPIHAFCEQAHLPCLLPNVESPVDSQRDFYSIYFSRGVLLEADLIAQRMPRSAPGAARSVVQVFRAGDVGEDGARALAAALQRDGIKVASRIVPREATASAVADEVARTTGSDALVLWLRPDDLAAVGSAALAPGAVYVSGLMGGLERAPLPSDWRDRTRLAYPFDLPDKRRVRVDFALGWFRMRHIRLVAEPVQTDTYLALSLLSETVNHMVDTFVRDYLVERMEGQLEHRIVTGYYPRLALATSQRFASKGGYVVRWAEPTGTRIVPEGEWSNPGP